MTELDARTIGLAMDMSALIGLIIGLVIGYIAWGPHIIK
jgi:hypothetical protein